MAGENIAEVTLLINSDARLQSLATAKVQLEGLLRTARESGRDTAPFEAELKKINDELGMRTMDAWAQGLQRLIDKEKAAGNSTQILEGQLAAVQDSKKLGAFGKITEELRAFGKEIPGVGAAMDMLSGKTGAVLIALAALTTTFEAAKKGLEEYAKQEQAIAVLDGTLAQRGLLLDQYRERLQKLSDVLQGQTGIDNTAWINSLQRILNFKEANPERIEEYANAIKNLAGLMGGDIESATQMFTRAMGGQMRGFAQLGIEIKLTGDKVKDTDRLMQELSDRGGGLMEARMNTITGAEKGAKNALDDFLKGLGNTISRTGAVQTALLGIQGILEFWGKELFPDTVAEMDGLENKLARLPEVSEEANEAAKKLAEDGLKKMADAAQKADQALADYLERIKELQKRQAEIIDAKLSLDLAQVDAGTGKYAGMTDSQKTIERQKLKDRAEGDKESLNLHATVDQKDAIRQAQAAKDIQADLDAKAAYYARQNVGKVQQNNQAEIDKQNELNRKKTLTEANAQTTQGQLSEVNEQIAAGDRSRGGYVDPALYARQKELQKQLEEERARADALQKQIEPIAANEPNRKAALEKANQAAVLAQAKADASAKDATDTRDKTDKQLRDLEEEFRHQATVGDLRTQTQNVTSKATSDEQKKKEDQTAAQKQDQHAAGIIATDAGKLDRKPDDVMGRQPNNVDGKHWQQSRFDVAGAQAEVAKAQEKLAKDAGSGHATAEDAQELYKALMTLLQAINQAHGENSQAGQAKQVANYALELARKIEKDQAALTQQVKNTRN